MWYNGAMLVTELALPVELRLVERQSPLLRPSELPCRRGLPALNLSWGCAHGCLYCYARGYSNAPPQGQVWLYHDASRRLLAEIDSPRRRRSWPPYVQFSTATDVFQPIPQLHQIAYQVIACLLERGIGVSILTKGQIPETFYPLLAHHRQRVQVTVGLVSADSGYQRAFEPRAAPVEARLGQLRRLAELGIAVAARMDPVIPRVTDTPTRLETTLSALAGVGVREVGVGFLFLRSAVRRNLALGLPSFLWQDILARYQGGPHLPLAESKGSWLLPASYRQQSYRRLQEMAADFGLVTRLCHCKNLDLGGQTCPQPSMGPALRGPLFSSQGA